MKTHRFSLGRFCAPVIALGILLGCTGSGGTGGSRVKGAGRGVLVISIDSLRADHLGLFGYDRDTTPALDALAAEGVSFRQTWSAAPRNLPAHCAILTGCDPNLARRYYRMESEAPEASRFVIPEVMPHMAVSMLGAGFATAAFMDSEILAPVTGLDAGFQRYFEVGEELPGTGLAGGDVGIEGVSSRFMTWARNLKRGEDWFAYLEVADLERVWRHRDPPWDNRYIARPGMHDVPPISNDVKAFFAQPRSRWLGGAVSLGQYEARYDGRLRRVDQDLGALFVALRQSGLFENTTICVVGSTGLQFGEAGLILDHGLYSTWDLHVPWIVRPGKGVDFEAGLVSDALASTIDVAPTLLGIAGVKQPGGMLGKSQVVNLTSRAGGPAAVREFAFASCGYQAGGAALTLDCGLQMTFPGHSIAVTGTSLSRSWYGDGLPHLGEDVRRFFNPLTGASQAVSSERQLQVRAVAMEWFALSQDARRAIFGSVWRGDALAPGRVDELVELGWLARRP